jgi:hypothetical protein
MTAWVRALSGTEQNEMFDMKRREFILALGGTRCGLRSLARSSLPRCR